MSRAEEPSIRLAVNERNTWGTKEHKMYQSPGSLEYAAAYQQNEAMRYVAHRELERQVDHHSSAQHRMVAAAVALLLVIVLVVAI